MSVFDASGMDESLIQPSHHELKCLNLLITYLALFYEYITF
jgi:hypothetical protein